MKYLFFLLLTVSLVACSKNKDDNEPDPGKRTTVKFTNKLARSFQNVKIGIIKGGDGILIKNVGTLSQSGDTGEIEVKDQSVIQVFFYYDEGDKSYYTDYGFSIAQGTFNNWDINSNTIFNVIQKTSKLYPK